MHTLLSLQNIVLWRDLSQRVVKNMYVKLPGQTISSKPNSDIGQIILTLTHILSMSIAELPGRPKL